MTPLNLYLLGSLVLLLFLFRLLRRQQPKKIVAYTTDNGKVTVNRLAVVDLVRASCEQMGQVRKPCIRVYIKRKRMHLTIRVQLSKSGNLREIETTLQNHLRKNLSENLGIENLGKIDVIVTNFKSSRMELPVSVVPKPKPKPASEATEKSVPGDTAESESEPVVGNAEADPVETVVDVAEGESDAVETDLDSGEAPGDDEEKSSS